MLSTILSMLYNLRIAERIIYIAENTLIDAASQWQYARLITIYKTTLKSLITHKFQKYYLVLSINFLDQFGGNFSLLSWDS